MHDVPGVTVDGLPDPVPHDLTVLDVREPVEWQHGHIDGALHIPLTELVERLDEVPEGRMLVVCQVGGRSAQAVAYLNQRGHDAVNLRGGMVDWADSGRRMVSETDQPPYVV
ncbi:MAG TPA: rhodanese-like domain-containing protein [Nocardioides sp.]|nr:rhodanese-like domain-containing protein [Nocardioides sp.]